MSQTSDHLIWISGTPVRYIIPAELIAGYGKEKTRIEFGTPDDVKNMGLFGYLAKTKRVATLYYGVVGDFQDFEMTVSLWAIQFDSQMSTTGQLADYVRTALRKEYTLKDGTKLVSAVNVSNTTVGERNAVTAVTEDTKPARTVAGKNGSVIILLPRQSYFVPITPTLVFGIYVEHFTKKSPDAQRIAFGDKLSRQIIESLNFESP